jgi:glycopeptide antibiotics resistance protein
VAGLVLLLVHLLIVGWLTLRPMDVSWVTAANLRPFAGIRADLAAGPGHAVRRIGAGLALLAPLGVLLPVLGGRLKVSWWASLARTVGTGVLVSLGIELLQTGVPGQVVDVDALILNTAGVAVAHLLVVPAARARLRRAVELRAERRGRDGVVRESDAAGAAAVPEADAPAGSTPKISRVGTAP